MLATRLRNAVQRLCCLWQGTFRREIGERDNADEALVAVHDGQTPDLKLRHVLCDVSNILVLEAVFDLGTHCVAASLSFSVTGSSPASIFFIRAAAPRIV